jgi:hypothetical protein
MWLPTLTTVLFASHVTAGVISDGSIVARKDTMEEYMRRAVEKVVEPIAKRQSMTLAQWDAQTQTACITSLRSLNGVASNPSGLAACYNLPMFDNRTGVFQADLRIYKISEPLGAFQTIPTSQIKVGLSYIGATVSPVDKSSIAARDERNSLISWPKRQVGVAPVLTQEYTFVGQINADLIRANMGT